MLSRKRWMGEISGFVVIDTAPTGHTLLLLDAANAYHRDVERNLSYIPDSVRRLLPQLRDSEFTKILIVALPEATPVHEAARLQRRSRSCGHHPIRLGREPEFCCNRHQGSRSVGACRR